MPGLCSDRCHPSVTGVWGQCFLLMPPSISTEYTQSQEATGAPADFRCQKGQSHKERNTALHLHCPRSRQLPCRESPSELKRHNLKTVAHPSSAPGQWCPRPPHQQGQTCYQFFWKGTDCCLPSHQQVTHSHLPSGRGPTVCEPRESRTWFFPFSMRMLVTFPNGRPKAITSVSVTSPGSFRI